MPTSATGSNRRAAGFSLVELLVVVAMLGLLGGAVLLTLPPDAARAADQADRLAAHLARAREEAVLANRAVAVRVDAGGYRFEQRREGRWQALDEGDLRQRLQVRRYGSHYLAHLIDLSTLEVVEC